MPQLGGVLETALYVEDLDRSLRFYQALMGFERIDSSERLYVMRIADHQLLLLCKRGAASDHEGSGNLHLAFSISASDLASWEQWLVQNDVPIEKKVRWRRGRHNLFSCNYMGSERLLLPFCYVPNRRLPRSTIEGGFSAHLRSALSFVGLTSTTFNVEGVFSRDR